MNTTSPRKVWRLDADGRLSPRANQRAWRVVSADRGRVDSAADYLFCAPDFLFPVDSVARALRLEIDRNRPAVSKPARSARP